MRVRKTLALMLIVTATACAAGEDGSSPAPTVTELSPQQADRALQLYTEQACNVCHGDLAEGGENGPALAGLAPYWTSPRLVEYLKSPEAFRAANPDFDDRRQIEYEMEMPGFDYVPEADLRLIADWLMSRPALTDGD